MEEATPPIRTVSRDYYQWTRKPTGSSLCVIPANAKHSISAAKCFRALFTSQGGLSERFARLVTAELIASIVVTQSNPSSDLIEVPRLVSTMVDVVQHHNPGEGFSLSCHSLTYSSDLQSVLGVTSFIDML